MTTKEKIDKKTGELTLAKPYIRKPYERHRVQTPIVGESMTHQAHAVTCDINNIIRKFDNTGVLPPAQHQGQYADVTGLQGDLTQAYNDAKETIDTSSKFFKEKQREQKKRQNEKQLDLEKEIAELKEKVNNGSAGKAPASPSSPPSK